MKSIFAALRTPLDFGAARNMIGLPPALTSARQVTDGIRVDEAGNTSINGIPLAVTPQTPALAIPSRAQVDGNQPVAAPITDTDNTGEGATVPVVFAGAGEIVALKRPQGRRIALLIQNLSVVGNIFYCFDRTADNATCVAIAAGGNRDYDKAVPQGDLHIFSSGAGTVIIEVINKA